MDLQLDNEGTVFHPPSRAAFRAYYLDNSRWTIILEMLREHLEFFRVLHVGETYEMPPSEAFSDDGAALRYALQFGPVVVNEHPEYEDHERYAARIGLDGEGEVAYASTPAHAIMLAVALMLLEIRELMLNQDMGGSIAIH